MNQDRVIRKLKRYFDIEELVDKEVYGRYGERAWRFFDYRLLVVLLWLREEINSPITINNWKFGGSFDERGLRTNRSSIVRKKNRLYLSAHLRGSAIDFDVEGMTSIEVRSWLKVREDQVPFHIRLERKLNGKEISWVHLDVDFEPKNSKVYLFDI